MDGLEKRFAGMISRSWWSLLLRGLAAIVFGVLTWLQPGISLAALVLVFGAYALFDGALAVAAGISGRKRHDKWWIMLLAGLFGLAVGVLTLTRPGVTALALLYYIAIWAVAQGVFEIMAAIHLRKAIRGEWLLILAGIASVVFGVLLMVQPARGALALLWLIATYAIIAGILHVVLAFRVRRFGKHLLAPA
jgi:uncharacterized membrane protein HdeD (DUF308 family)